jgi:hypothetical protein
MMTAARNVPENAATDASQSGAADDGADHAELEADPSRWRGGSQVTEDQRRSEAAERARQHEHGPADTYLPKPIQVAYSLPCTANSSEY